MQRWTNATKLLPASGCLITSLLETVDTFTRSFATHGVGESNPKPSGLARFYKNVTIKEAFDQGGYQIYLDSRLLKTPAKHPLVLPNRSLALAVAAEWEMQRTKIQPYTMPLMSLAATAVDQPREKAVVIETMLQYLPTDPVVCRSEPGKLADVQASALDPVLQWAVKELGVELMVTDSIFGAEISEAALESIRQYLQGLDKWHLTAAEQLASACKSVLVALALLKGQINLEQALKAARLEENYQIDQWGLVEGGHDIDIADVNVRVAAPHVFVRLLSDS